MLLVLKLTIIVWVLPLLVTPYAKIVPLMPSIDDWTTFSLVAQYTCRHSDEYVVSDDVMTELVQEKALPNCWHLVMIVA